MQELVIFLLIAALGGLGYAYWRLQNLLLPAFNQQRAEIHRLSAVIEQAQTQLTHPQSSSTNKPLASDVEAEHQSQLAMLKQQNEQVEQTLTTLEQENAQLKQTISTLEQENAQLAQKHAYQLALTLTLSNAAYDALLVLDENCQVLATNSAAEALFEITEHTNRLLSELTQSPELQMMVEDVLSNEEEILEEQMTIHERGFLVRAQIIRRDGYRFIGLALQDVTQLIRLNRARRDMVANISHELRTPIANIRVIIDGLFHDQDKPKRKDSISSLRAIARETDALLWLVQEMADLSMIESGQAIVRMIDVSLAEVINEACDRLTDQLSSKDLHIVRQIPETLRVLCDRDLIQRVIVNLLHNAMKWSPPHQPITVTAVSNGEEVIVSVFDKGTGVPIDQVDRIFERFYQVDASRSGNEGTGLGLAICKHIVVAHGGRIWAEDNTQDTGGGRFKFTLLTADSPAEIQPYPVSAVLDNLNDSLE